MTTQELRKKLKQYLAENNKTISSLAQKTGISFGVYSKILDGALVRKETELRVIKALRLDEFESDIDISILDEDYSFKSYRESLIPTMVKAQKKKEKNKKMARHPTMANTWILIDR